MQTLDFETARALTVLGLILVGILWLIITGIMGSRSAEIAENEEMLEYGRKEARLYKEFTKAGVLIELLDGKKYVALLSEEGVYHKVGFNANSISQVFNACYMTSNFRTLYEIPSWFKYDYKTILTTTRQIREADSLIINQEAVATITLLTDVRGEDTLYHYYRQPKGYPSFKELLAELEYKG